MKLGAFSVGLPLYEIESDVTYQTVRAPTVFERMVMRLCGRYRTTPEIAGMTLSQIFEKQLGVASANDLVRPSVENLIYMGVLANPGSQDYMTIRLADLSLTADGFAFLERDRLPSRSQQATVTHRFFPLSNSVKSQRLDNRLSQTPIKPFVSDAVLQPSDCSALVREAVAGERHAWKSPSTEIHSVQSRVLGVAWEQHQVSIECDEAGVLAIKAQGSPDLDRWLALANPDVIWQHILEPVLAIEASSGWPTLSQASFSSALAIAPLGNGSTEAGTPVDSPRTALRVLVDEAQLERHVDEDVVLLKREGRVIQRLTALFKSVDPGVRRLPSKQGTIWLEMAAPSDLPQGFDGLILRNEDHSPEAHLTGLAKVFWAGQERRAVLGLTADKNTSRHVWGAIQAALQSGLTSSQDADVFALAATWEPPQETISRWRSRVAALALKELIADASNFALALERFSPRSGGDWRPDWHGALSDQLVAAISHLDEEVALDDILGWLLDIDRLLPSKSGDVMQALLAHCGTVSDVESLARLREATGPSFALPDRVVGDALLQKWITDAFSDGVLTLFGPHSYAQPIELIRSAHQAVLRDVGLKSLEDAASGNLSLQGVKTSALASVSRWQAASEAVRGMRPAFAGDAMSRVAKFDTMVGAWRALASQRLAHPAPSGQRLVVLDTSALMQVPDLLSTMRRGDIPIVPRRVLEELDGIKESAEEDKAQKARSAIRSLERAGQAVSYESEVLDLLPPDWEPTSDNRILSVALYLRLSDVLVVTGDRNFRNKARAENIAAMLPEEYRGVTPNQGSRRETGRRRR